MKGNRLFYLEIYKVNEYNKSKKITYVMKQKGKSMSEKRLNNTIFLMYLVTENYCKKHGLSTTDFLKLDEQYAILNYVAECPDIFDSLTENEMVEEVEAYVAQA